MTDGDAQLTSAFALWSQTYRRRLPLAHRLPCFHQRFEMTPPVYLCLFAAQEKGEEEEEEARQQQLGEPWLEALVHSGEQGAKRLKQRLQGS